MSARTSVAAGRASSLWAATGVAVIAILVGWFIAADTSGPTTVNLGGTEYELPAGWVVIEQNADEIVSQRGLGLDTLEILKTDAIGAPTSIEMWEQVVGPSRYPLFSVTARGDDVADFRYVEVDGFGAPDVVMLGRFLLAGDAAITVHAGPERAGELLEDAEAVAESAR